VIGGALLVALLAQAQGPPRDTRPAVSTATASIAGVVTSDEPKPRPLRRARVTLNGHVLEMGRTTITDDDGAFAFESLPAGRYLLSAVKEAYVTMEHGARQPGRMGTGVTVASGETARVTLRLPRGAVITGMVSDVDGQPAQGILVTALVRRFAGTEGRARYQPAATSPSDDRGVYRIYGLAAGTYLVAAQPQTPPRPGGQPMAGTRIVSQGSDRLSMLSQVFHPAATDVLNASRITVTPGEERVGIDVRLQYVPLAKVSGYVTPPGTYSRLTLILVRSDDPLASEQSVRIGTAAADADGRFEFGNVAPGQYAISALASAVGDPAAWRVARTDVVVNGEDLTGVAVSLDPAFRIAGRLVVEGSTVPPDLTLHVPLPFAPSSATPGMMGVSLDVHGDRFTAGPFGPGPYRRINFRSQEGVATPIGKWWLKSVVANGRDILDAPLDLHHSVDDAVATLSDRASELTGRVTDAKGDAAYEAVVVVFSTNRATWFPASRRIAGVHPDKDGRYAIHNLPPGDYRVMATIDLDEWEWFDPDVLDRSSAAATPITIAGVEKKIVDLRVR
jgi:uncharacterized protein (DUF2141 family)